MNYRKYGLLILLVVVIVFSGCSAPVEKGPVVGPIQVAPSANIEAGSTVTLAVNASGDNIRFAWETNAGAFISDAGKSSVTYQAPMKPGPVIITVTVTDRGGHSNTQNITLTCVGKPTSTALPTSTATPTPTKTLKPVNTLTIPPIVPPEPTPTPPGTYVIMKEDGKLASGLDMGVDTSEREHNWISVQRGELCMAYPADQSWGAVFITVGKPTDIDRPGRDFSAYRKLSFEIKGVAGGEYLLVGLKDNTDEDTGEETKKLVDNLSTAYQTVEFSLADFTTADLQKIYVLVEFVFEQTPTNVCVKNIRYLP